MKTLFMGAALFLAFGLNAQTVVPPPDSTEITHSPTDPRGLGWPGGLTYTLENEMWPEFRDTCYFFGFNDTLYGAINGYNTSPPNTDCDGMTDLVYNSILSDLVNGVVVYTGTTRMRYVNTSGNFVINTLSVRAIIDIGEPLSIYNGRFLLKTGSTLTFDVIYEIYSPPAALYFSGGANTWTPAITLFNNLHTSSSSSICTNFDPGEFVIYVPSDSAWAIDGNVFATGDSILLRNNDKPGYTYTWSGPLGFNSTQAWDTIDLATEFMTGNYVLDYMDPYGCPSADTLYLTVLTCNTFDTVTQTLCENYTSPSGKEFTTPGTYYDTIPNADLCDSLITINLNPRTEDLPVPTIQQVASDRLYVSQAYGAYLWFKDGEPIPTQYERELRVSTAGRYFVRVETSDGCLGYSNVIGLGEGLNVEDLLPHDQLLVFPNPAGAKLTIEFGNIPYSAKHIGMFNVLGEEVLTLDTDAMVEHLDLSSLATGTYSLKIISNEEVFHFQITKQ